MKEKNAYVNQQLRAVTKPLPEMIRYYKAEKDFFLHRVSSKDAVLDVGCGDGRVMKYLAPKAKHIIGIDYSHTLLKTARKNLRTRQNYTLLEKDIWTYHNPNKFSFVIVMYNLLGSRDEIKKKDRKRLMRHLYTMVKAGGHLIIGVWSLRGLPFAGKYYRSLGLRPVIKGRDVVTDILTSSRFSPSEIRSLTRGLHGQVKIIPITREWYFLDILKK